jgi:uncharacterized protein (DUF58 family)
MVRGDAPRQVAEALVVLDTAVADPDAFEAAASVAASLGVALLKAGHAVRFLETGPAQLPAPARFAPAGGSEPLLRAFAALERVPGVAEGWEAESVAELSARAVAEPIFLVLASVGGGRAEAAARLRPHADPALAELVGPEAPAARDALARAGWAAVAPVLPPLAHIQREGE